jgi:hypothetical protein
MHPITVKKRVRARDGHRCVKCGMTAEQHRAMYGRTLEVHRTTPGSIYLPELCVTLCCGCHYKEPKSKPGTGEAFKVRVFERYRKSLDKVLPGVPVAMQVRVAVDHMLAQHGLAAPKVLK